MSYYTIHTAAGLAEMAAAQVAQKAVPFTDLALGDGNGAAVLPDGRTALVHEVYRAKISGIRQHPTNPAWFIFEAAVPEEVGGFTVRELALIGGRAGGITMAIGNYPTTEKPLPADGAPRALVFRMVVAYANAAQIDVMIDPQAYATAATVAQQIAEHEAKADPHPQYTTAAEAGQAATAAAGDAVAAHEAKGDPHPQYMTAAETGLAVDGGIAAHEGKQDPHPQYMTQSEVDNRLLAGRAKRYFHTSF
jgi:phage-related tail fiber protein